MFSNYFSSIVKTRQSQPPQTHLFMSELLVWIHNINAARCNHWLKLSQHFIGHYAHVRVAVLTDVLVNGCCSQKFFQISPRLFYVLTSFVNNTVSIMFIITPSNVSFLQLNWALLVNWCRLCQKWAAQNCEFGYLKNNYDETSLWISFIIPGNHKIRGRLYSKFSRGRRCLTWYKITFDFFHKLFFPKVSYSVLLVGFLL